MTKEVKGMEKELRAIALWVETLDKDIYFPTGINLAGGYVPAEKVAEALKIIAIMLPTKEV